MVERTDWREITALVGAGVIGALQTGKVPPALLVVAQEFGFGLPGAAMLLSFFALLTGLMGCVAGSLAARLGTRRALVGGLVLTGLAGLGLAAAPGVPLLYAARLVEGLGFLAVVVSAPTLVAQRAAPRDRALALAIWAAFMPAGIAMGMLGAPLIEAWGWRGAWVLASLLALGWAVVAMVFVPRLVGGPQRGLGSPLAALRALVAARRPLLVAGCFASYVAIYFGIAAFLPAFVIERFGASLALAGAIGAVAAVANVIGNLLAGEALRRGLNPGRLVLVTGAAMSVLTAAGYAASPGLVPALVLSMAASLVGGAVPACLFATVPLVVPDPALTGPAMGLVIQCNNLGQVLTPPVIAAAVGFGWGWSAVPLLLAGVTLSFCAWPLSRVGVRA
ncbi:MFS transporter [Rhodovarius crocodyli]|nr:MFS transporter [Rhodovarius crocodyli]